MISKLKHNLFEYPFDNYFQNNYDLKGVKYKPQTYIPRESFYYTYFNQNKKSFPKKTLIITAMSYVSGVLFGMVMLVFSLMGTGSMALDQTKYKYESMKEFWKMAKETIKQSAHRNGIFMIRFGFLIAFFNASQIYMPYINSKFGNFYGYGNLDTIFYFAIPSFIMLKFNHCSLLKRLMYCFSIMMLHTAFKFIYIKEYNQNFLEFLNYKKINH